MKSWKICTLLVIITMTLWEFMQMDISWVVYIRIHILFFQYFKWYERVHKRIVFSFKTILPFWFAFTILFWVSSLKFVIVAKLLYSMSFVHGISIIFTLLWSLVMKLFIYLKELIFVAYSFLLFKRSAVTW